jgi:hypothetical protein
MNNPFSRVNFGQATDPSAYGFTPAQTGLSGPDERVRRALEGASTPFQVTPAHNFGVTLIYSQEGRSQLVFIGSETHISWQREWRRVWSWAFEVQGKLPWDKALTLMDEKNRKPVGSWFLCDEGGKTSVGYHMMVPADASPAELDAAIQSVGEYADDMEKMTVGTDAF